MGIFDMMPYAAGRGFTRDESGEIASDLTGRFIVIDGNTGLKPCALCWRPYRPRGKGSRGDRGRGGRGTCALWGRTYGAREEGCGVGVLEMGMLEAALGGRYGA